MKLPVNYNDIAQSERRKVREEYIRLQQGRCSHCDKLLVNKSAPFVANKPVNKKLFPKGFFNNPVHLHHSHDTGFTIGAVHAYCNAVLWQYHGE